MKRDGSNGGTTGNVSGMHVRIEERTVADPNVMTGEVRIPKELLRRLRLAEGQTVRVENGDRVTLLRAMPGFAPWIESNPEDLTGIGARSGATLSYVADNHSPS